MGEQCVLEDVSATGGKGKKNRNSKFRFDVFFKEDDERRCREVLSLVHCCPTAMDLELNKIVEECLRTDLAHLAVILVPYLSQVLLYILELLKGCYEIYLLGFLSYIFFKKTHI